MVNHYLTTKMVKMGKWALLPLDTEAWMSEEGGRYFKKYFGINKGILMILDPYEHGYVPEDYFPKLHSQIENINKKDLKGLENKLKEFYVIKSKVKKDLIINSKKSYETLSNARLLSLFKKNRQSTHLITVFDQFGWLGEEYWTPRMESVLLKLGLKKDSLEYNKVLFTLTKPEKISTTLSEKRDLLRQTLAIKEGKLSIEKASIKLSKLYGWMPVFAFGDSWTPEHYVKELISLRGKSIDELKREYLLLKDYSKNRNAEIKYIVREYKISARDLQIFIDFGLALDARNEAEYVLSFAGNIVRPMYEEIAKRLQISVTDLRLMYEAEIISSLLGKTDPNEILKQKRGMIAYGYDQEMKKRINFSQDEAKRMFDHIESYVKNIQGGNEFKGTCASPGKVKGIARIVHTPSENHKVQDGDILITHATTVDYLPAMKKASAIITEIGGLTCHAAVVSREFGIPCIVALKNAMKNFKEGETVEVDADRGIVKKI